MDNELVLNINSSKRPVLYTFLERYSMFAAYLLISSYFPIQKITLIDFQRFTISGYIQDATEFQP
jgi:hypothetical protein